MLGTFHWGTTCLFVEGPFLLRICHTITQNARPNSIRGSAKGHWSSSVCSPHISALPRRNLNPRNPTKKKWNCNILPLVVGFALSPKKLHSCLGSWFLVPCNLLSVSYLFNYQIFIEHTLRLMFTRIPMLSRLPHWVRRQGECVTNFAIC